MSDAEFDRRSAKIVAFADAHPELREALAMWQADRSGCELVYPEAVEILKREMGEF